MLASGEDNHVLLTTLHSLPWKERSRVALSVHSHSKRLGVLHCGLILHGHCMLTSISLKAGALVWLWLSSPIPSSLPPAASCFSLYSFNLPQFALAVVTSKWPWTHLGSLSIVCAMDQWQLTRRLVRKISLRSNARSVQLQDSAWSRADTQQVALLSPLLLPAHEHASSLTAQTQNSKSHSDRVLSGRALAISWHFKKTQGERHCDKDVYYRWLCE